MANPTGTSWGATPTVLGDAGGVVTWSITTAGYNLSVFPGAGGLSRDPDEVYTLDYLAVISQAFDDWSSHGNIEFMQVEDEGGDAGAATYPDIRIFFGVIAGNTIGWAHFPSIVTPASALAGDILLEGSDRFAALVIHEIGHALGMGHVPNGSPSVMTPTVGRSELTADDIAGIQEIYGPQDNAPSVYDMPAGQGNLNILQAPTDVHVNGNALDNKIDGTEIAESFDGAEGDDTLLGRSGFDTLRGGGGDDLLNGGAQADRLFGGDGDDSLLGGQGTDVLHGGAGNDTLNSGDEADRVYGGEGDDLILGGWSEGVKVDGLWGDAGNDTIFGQLGFDFIDGGPGDDLLDGGDQADNIYGGTGNDTLRGGQGLDRLFAGDGNDFGRGGTGNDGLFGGSGDDTLNGEEGNDRLFGEVGDDILDGATGNDTIYGGAGFDTITGGTGNDDLRGNFNADTFVFADGHGDDTVRDFAANNVFEKIDLSAVTAITDLADLQANHLDQVGANVVIDTGGGNSVTLLNVSIGDLDSTDFLF